MADILDPSPEYQAAVEAVLGEALQYVLVDAPQTGVRAIEYLQSHDAGRSGFIPVAALMQIEEDRQPAHEDSDRLLKHVAVKTGYERIAEAFLGHVVVAEDMHSGLALFNGSRRHTTIVTKQGDVISRQGIMIGGSMDKLPGILAKKQEIKALEQQINLPASRHSQRLASSSRRPKPMSAKSKPNCSGSTNRRSPSTRKQSRPRKRSTGHPRS